MAILRKEHRMEIKPDGAGLTINPKCPCPKIKCKRHGLCEACRAHHTKRKPFCEREKAEENDK
jgi:hypothetical protein